MNDSIAIVGSGIAGHSLARELRKLDSAVPITLVTADGGEIYAKPSLSVALSQGKQPDAIPNASAIKFAEQQRIDMRTRTTVGTIDLAGRQIHTDGGTLRFDRLVLALGAQQMPLPGIAQCNRVLSVNSLDDYRVFRTLLSDQRRALILGAGFIGCEFANDLVQVGVEVDVVDLAPHPLSRFWPPTLALIFESRMAQAGVRWHLDTQVTALQSEGRGVTTTLANGKILQSDFVLSALGLSPSTDLAHRAGLRVARGICVDAQLETSAAGVYALGDCAEVEGTVWPFVMPTLHCARALARTLTGTPTAVTFPPMPVALKTPACPAVFLPAMPGTIGLWSLESEDSAVLCTPSGKPLGVALLGAGVSRRDEWVKRLTVAQTVPGPCMSLK